MSKEEKNRVEVRYPGFAWDPPYAIVTADYRLCSGCRICEVACSVKNFGEFNPELSRIRIYDFYAGLLQIPSICWGCQWRGGEEGGGLDAPCVKACPTKALSCMKLCGFLLSTKNSVPSVAYAMKSVSNTRLRKIQRQKIRTCVLDAMEILSV